MATVEELSKAFNILLGAGLEYAPRGDEIAIRAAAWKETLADIPGKLLIQAAVDLAKTVDHFPTVAAVRRQASQVKIHNGTGREDDFDTRSRVWPRAAPKWVQVENDRLEREIGYLLKKRREDWTAEDVVAYERAIGAAEGSQAEHAYWCKLLAAAYYTEDECGA